MQYSNISWNIVMVKWFCSSALCFNNFTSKDCNGRPLKYYCLTREESIQPKYKKIFQTDGINWNKDHICLDHWSHKERKVLMMRKETVIMIRLIFQFLQTNYRKSRKNMKQQKMCWKNIKLPTKITY